MADHEFGSVPHDRLSLLMEVPHHFVTPLTPNETDDISVNTETKECHGTGHLKVPRRDIFMCETQMGPC